jgi:hypothetical protein
MGEEKDSLLADLAKLLPGYNAYTEQEARRTDDRATRDFLVVRLRDCKAALDRLGARAVAENDWERPAQLESLRAHLDLAESRLSAHVDRYADWFSEPEVDVALLSQAAELDASLVSIVDQIDAIIKAALGADAGLNDAEFLSLVERLYAHIDRRTELLNKNNV